jgi:hypothetical protein
MIKLVMTCGACPEQYDAYRNGEQVGYLRLRHGHFRVNCPDSRGIEMFAASPRGDGIFTDDERDGFLREAVSAIILFHEGIKIPPEKVKFVMAVDNFD